MYFRKELDNKVIAVLRAGRKPSSVYLGEAEVRELMLHNMRFSRESGSYIPILYDDIISLSAMLRLVDHLHPSGLSFVSAGYMMNVVVVNKPTFLALGVRHRAKTQPI